MLGYLKKHLRFCHQNQTYLMEPASILRWPLNQQKLIFIRFEKHFLFLFLFPQHGLYSLFFILLEMFLT